MRIFVVGSINMDLVIHTPYMPENGVTLEGSGFMTNPGGKGANQAVAVSKLGGQAVMVGCVGETFGEQLRSSLNRYGVHCDFVETVEGSSGIAVIVVENGDNRIFLDRAANSKVDFELIDRALMTAKAGDMLLVQLEIPVESVLYAMRIAKSKGMTTFLNPAPARELPDEAFGLADYFTPNRSETAFYTGIRPDGEKEIVRCAEILHAKGCKNVLMTLGTDGSVFVAQNAKPLFVPCRPAEAVDTTGAGDTFVGAFAVALSEGKPVETAMRFAAAASSVTVTRRGAQAAIPYRNEVTL